MDAFPRDSCAVGPRQHQVPVRGPSGLWARTTGVRRPSCGGARDRPFAGRFRQRAAALVPTSMGRVARDEFDDWGPATYFLEVGDDGWPERQIGVYDTGPILCYGREHEEDQFGFLGQLSLDALDDWAPYAITLPSSPMPGGCLVCCSHPARPCRRWMPSCRTCGDRWCTRWLARSLPASRARCGYLGRDATTTASICEQPAAITSRYCSMPRRPGRRRPRRRGWRRSAPR